MAMLRLLPSLILIAAPAIAAEEVISIPSNGSQVIGTLNTSGANPQPVVLMLHGFTGARDELATDAVPAGVFATTAQALSEAGYASLRIDFRGSGESTSDVSFADTTFEGQVADALAAIEYLRASDKVAGDDISVLGWSQGGLVAASAAARAGDLDSLVLWNAVASPEEAYGSIFGADTLANAIAADADQLVDLTLPWGVDIQLKGAFFDQVASFDPGQEIAGFKGPLLVAQGSKDTTVLPKSADIFLAAHEGKEEIWTAEMDHVFNVFAGDAEFNAMVEATIGFLDTHQD